MDQLHKFLFEGLAVRGMLVRLDGSWRELLARRTSTHDGGHAFPAPVRSLLGEMAAASCLMQSNLKFNGALILQVFGDGPVKLAVAEAQPDLSFRATAKVVGEVPATAQLEAMLNLHGKGRCAITLDPKDRLPGQQPYQGVVPLHGDRPEPVRPPEGRGPEREARRHRYAPLQKLSEVIEHYMLQSEQLDTKLVLAANDEIAAGLLVQRLPVTGEANLAGGGAVPRDEDQIGRNEDYNRIALLAGTLERDELLRLDTLQLLHRLFWQETLRLFEPLTPRFACRCSRERVAGMLRGLGRDEVDSIIDERGEAEVGCDFCGAQYRFDRIDAAELFMPARVAPPSSSQLQ
jgi:molecular chaperone Hsp33